MTKILYLLFIGLLNTNVLCDDSNYFNDDYIDNTNIHINVYNTYNDCITNNNSLYNSKISFEFICECISETKCFNNLLNSSKFNKLYFEYNSNIYLHKLNYTDQCQKYENYYIFHNIEIYTFCSTIAIVYVFIILLILICIISFINYKYQNNSFIKINNNVPPKYDYIKIKINHNVPPKYDAIN